jgi:protein gp37
MFREKKMYGQEPNVVLRSKTTFNDPLKWTSPLMVFTCSWSDWFIEEADIWRDEAWDIIRRTPHLTYQILTKRIERARGRVPAPPLPNVWLGVSVEDRKNKNRIDILRETPVALRFLSVEPLLEDIGELDLRGIDWVIVGGESGPGARPFDVQWARNIIAQCKAAGVACFVKQLGAKPFLSREADGVFCPDYEYRLRNRKGGDWDEWAEDLRVRQFPEVRNAARV